MRSSFLLSAVLTAALHLASPAFAAGFRDVLDTPARVSPLVPRSMMNGLAQAGERIVAVGQRGHIAYSDDSGTTWRQAMVPVSSDLLAVSFPTAKLGWAVGHDGVILHSADAGLTWTLQLDGRRSGDLMRKHYAALAAKGELGPPADAQRVLDDIARIADQGPENSLLDVWFADERSGFAVGSFNLVFRTDDGGKTWAPWYHATENPNRLHLYAVRGIGANVYLAGEQGLLLKLASGDNRFRALATPYRGSFFGIAGNAKALVAFGLRGNAFRSTDGGTNWHQVTTGLQEGITAGTLLKGDVLVLVSQSGQVLLGTNTGESFFATRLERPAPAAAVLGVGNGAVLVAGPRGIQRHSLP